MPVNLHPLTSVNWTCFLNNKAFMRFICASTTVPCICFSCTATFFWIATLGETIVNTTVMSKLSTSTLSYEVLAIFIINMVVRLIGNFSSLLIRFINRFIHITENIFPFVCNIHMLTGSVFKFKDLNRSRHTFRNRNLIGPSFQRRRHKNQFF